MTGSILSALSDLALLPPQSIHPRGDAPLASILLPDLPPVPAQIGPGAPLPEARVRLVSMEDLGNLSAQEGFPLVVTQVPSPEDGADCLDCPDVLAVSGLWAEDSARIRDFYLKLFRFELAHVGINLPSDEEAFLVAESFARLFGMEQAVNPGSIFCGGTVEVLRAPGPGERGHLAIRTSHLERAVAYFRRQGLALRTESPMYRPDGLMMGVYFQRSFGGFAVHLMRRV